jgi:hypothetical protein
MKINKLILGIGVFGSLTLLSCRKEETSVNTQAPTGTESSIASLSAWNTVSSNAGKSTTGSEHSGYINDGLITADVANSGLVLLFSKAAGTDNATSFAEASVDGNYHVETGNIVVNGVVQLKDQQFQYVIFSEDQLKQLADKGYSRDQLVSLSYKQAFALFGN